MLGAALLSAGTSLLSGLFGQSSAKKQARKEEEAIRVANDIASANATQMNKEIRARADAAALVPVQTSHETLQMSQGGVDMKAFMAAAEENGFNPLTFLRSGALSLFSTNVGYTDDFTCTTGERAMDAALSGTYLPQLSPVIANTRVPGTGEIFGNALTSGVNQYLSDSNQQRQNEFQMQLLNAQLAGANRPGSYSGLRFGSVPSAKLTGGRTQTDESLPPLMQAWYDNRWADPQGPMPSGAAMPQRVVWLPSNKLPDNDQVATLGLRSGWEILRDWVGGTRRLTTNLSNPSSPGSAAGTLPPLPGDPYSMPR